MKFIKFQVILMKVILSQVTEGETTIFLVGSPGENTAHIIAVNANGCSWITAVFRKESGYDGPSGDLFGLTGVLRNNLLIIAAPSYQRWSLSPSHIFIITNHSSSSPLPSSSSSSSL